MFSHYAVSPERPCANVLRLPFWVDTDFPLRFSERIVTFDYYYEWRFTCKLRIFLMAGSISSKIDKTISHYKIIEKLGEGAMGVVYKAWDIQLERNVAIKFLARQMEANDDEQKRFRIEARAAAVLNHPNIAHVYGIEDDGDEMFIVMEFINGQELQKGIRETGVTTEKILDICTQIVSGLQAAHRQGVIHRDIKSANIMITVEWQAKIMDFGLAKVRGAGPLTSADTILGTTAYMSPQQARGEEVDHRADIWSFGVVLYEILTGELPFKGDGHLAMIHSIMNDEPTRPTELDSNLPCELEAIVFKCLRKEVQDRYESAEQLESDLKKLKEYLKSSGFNYLSSEKGGTFRGLQGGCYEIEKELGERSYGRTYKGRVIGRKKGVPDTYVILKFPNFDLDKPTQEINKRLTKFGLTFNSEIQGMERLAELTCVAHLVDFGAFRTVIRYQTFASHFMVQELIEGKRLDVFLNDNSTRNEFKGFETYQDFFGWASRIAQNLAKVHRREVVHGDIRPGNIMVKSDHKPILIDFGQSMLVDLAFDAPGSKAYTNVYCAPERQNPNRKWSYGADVYSLGGVLFYLATGSDPPDSIEDIDELKNTITDNVGRTNYRLYNDNPGVVDIISRCLRFSDRDRTRSVEAVLQDLESFSVRSANIPLVESANKLVTVARNIESGKNILFSSLASLRMRQLERELGKMQRGLYEIAGDHEEIARGLTQFLSLLGQGDQYLTVTIPSFWHPQNLGINGRFLTMNRLAAQRGVALKRIFLLTEEDEQNDKHLKEILSSHHRVMSELNGMGVSTEKLGKGFYTGVKKMEPEEREGHLNDSHHFGLWRRDEDEVMIVPIYREKDGNIVSTRFWSSPDRASDLKSLLAQWLQDSVPLLEYTSTSD